MKKITTLIAATLLLLPIMITAQSEKGTKLSDLSPKEKMQILANQIQLRDDRISEMEKEIARLQKRSSKKSITSKSSDKEFLQTKAQLQIAEDALQVAKSDNEKFQKIIQRLEAKANNNTQQVNSSSSADTEQIADLQNRLTNAETENITLAAKLRAAENELISKQAQIVSLQNISKNYTAQPPAVESNSKKIKNKRINEVETIEKKPVYGKNYFYITASQNLSIDNNYGVEIGKIKSFNKRSTKAIRLGLDVAYLSANLRNFNLDEIDTSLEEPTGAVGIKIGPNLNVRIMKGIIFNASYRFFPAANVTTIDEELDVKYKGYHTAGGNLKIGPVMARLEFDITKQEIDPSATKPETPMTVYLGLMF